MKFPKLTPSFIISMIALTVSLGGTSYAAVTAITSRQIVDGTIRGRDIAPATLNGSKIKNGSITQEDLAAGAGGLTGYKVVLGEEVFAAANGGVLGSVKCPTGTRVVGGGGSTNGTKGVSIVQSFPGHYTSAAAHVNADSEWTVYWWNASTAAIAARPYAICAKASI